MVRIDEYYIVLGKTIENVRNKVDICFVQSEDKARKLAAESNFCNNSIFDENLMAVHAHQTKIKLYKPVYLEMSILDLSTN